MPDGFVTTGGSGGEDSDDEKEKGAFGVLFGPVARQFDSEKGGGFADQALGVPEEGAASLGESVSAPADLAGKQFDSEQGGGYADHVLGVPEKGAATVGESVMAGGRAAESAKKEAFPDTYRATDQAAQTATQTLSGMGLAKWLKGGMVLVGLFLAGRILTPAAQAASATASTAENLTEDENE